MNALIIGDGLKHILEGQIKSAKNWIKLDRLSIKTNKALNKLNEASLRHLTTNPSDCFFSFINNCIKSNKDSIKRCKASIKKEKERLAKLQEDYNRRYAEEDAKNKIFLVEFSAKPFKKSTNTIGKETLSVIKGGFYRNPEPKAIINDSILTVHGDAWLKKERAKKEDQKNS